MKKLLLLAAFAGLLGSSAVANTKGDDKDKKTKKECCKKADGKACPGEKKDGASKEKACCKKKAEGEKATEEKK
jgi:hypothetical protein